MVDIGMRNDGEQSSDGDLGLRAHGSGNNDAAGTSPKQIAANRRNAMRSTGPRTAEGKLASKFNATKHGLRASEIVIPGQEDPAEFEAFLQELRDDWMPQGRTEIFLVTEIAIAHWRLRRAHRAELGEIRKRIMEETPRGPADDIAGRIPRSRSFKMSVDGIGRLKSAVGEAMGELESEGTVSQETCEKLEKMFGDETYNPGRELRLLRLDEVGNPVPKSMENIRPTKGMKSENSASILRSVGKTSTA